MKENKKLNISWRILCVSLSVFALFSLFSESAFAAKSAGEGFEWSFEKGILTITGKGEMRDFTENDTPPWHKHRNQIRAVVIGEGITSIGELAFYKYENVVSVTLSNTVKEIERFAFSDCTALEMINLGNGLEVIGDSAFARCESLTSIRMPKSLKVIGEKAFYRCTDLHSVSIPESVTSLGNMIFTYCEKLVGASVQANVNNVPEWMFYGCPNLSEVVLNPEIKSAEDRAFYGCDSFTSLYYPSEDKSELLEAIKETSLPSFAEENIRIDSPTNDELEGTESTFEDNVLVSIETSTKEGSGSIITTKVTETSKLENFELTDPVLSSNIDALIDNPVGWDELLAKINYVIDNSLQGSGHLYVSVNLLVGDVVPSSVLSQLAGEKVQVNVNLSNGSSFGVDCEKVTKNNTEQKDLSVDYNMVKNDTLSETFKEILAGADTFDVKYNNNVDINFSSSIYVGKETAYSIATIYKINENNELERVQSAVIDKEGNATFYLQSVTSDTNLVLGVGVKGEKVEDAIIPDSVAVDQYGLLDRYRPIEYATLDDREFMGMNSWQFTLAVVGVVGGIVIIVSIVAVIIYRKKRLELIQNMKKAKV